MRVRLGPISWKVTAPSTWPFWPLERHTMRSSGICSRIVASQVRWLRKICALKLILFVVRRLGVLDLLHEAGERAELGPLVVGNLDGYADVDRLDDVGRLGGLAATALPPPPPVTLSLIPDAAPLRPPSTGLSPLAVASPALATALPIGAALADVGELVGQTAQLVVDGVQALSPRLRSSSWPESFSWSSPRSVLLPSRSAPRARAGARAAARWTSWRRRLLGRCLLRRGLLGRRDFLRGVSWPRTSSPARTSSRPRCAWLADFFAGVRLLRGRLLGPSSSPESSWPEPSWPEPSSPRLLGGALLARRTSSPRAFWRAPRRPPRDRDLDLASPESLRLRVLGLLFGSASVLLVGLRVLGLFLVRLFLVLGLFSSRPRLCPRPYSSSALVLLGIGLVRPRPRHSSSPRPRPRTRPRRTRPRRVPRLRSVLVGVVLPTLAARCERAVRGREAIAGDGDGGRSCCAEQLVPDAVLQLADLWILLGQLTQLPHQRLRVGGHSLASEHAPDGDGQLELLGPAQQVASGYAEPNFGSGHGSPCCSLDVAGRATLPRAPPRPTRSASEPSPVALPVPLPTWRL